MKVTFNRKVLALAVVSSLGGFMTVNAQAAVWLGTAPTGFNGGQVTYAEEQNVANEPGLTLANAGTNAGILDVRTLLGFGVSTGGYIRLDLDNGARFPAGTTFSLDVCDNSTASCAAVLPALSAGSAGGAGNSFVVLGIDQAKLTGLNVTQNSTVIIKATNFNATTKNAVSATYKLYDGSSASAATNNASNYLATSSGSLWKFGPSYTVKSNLGGDNTSEKIDVTKGSAEFAKTSATKFVKLGEISIQQNAVYLADGSQLVATAPISVISTAVTGTSTRLNVSGDFSAFASSANKVFTQSNASATACDSATGASHTSTSGGATTTASGAVIVLGNAVYTNLAICAEANGTTAMSGGQYSATYAPVSADTAKYTVANSSDLLMYKLIKNGKSFKVLNIPNATAADKSFIRVYNSGSTALTVRTTVYNQDGSMVGTANSTIVEALASNAVSVIDVAALQTAVGGTVGAGRAWARLEADSANVEVALLIRAANGTLINASGSIIHDAAFPN